MPSPPKADSLVAVGLQKHLTKRYGIGSYERFIQAIQRGDSDSMLAGQLGISRQAVGPLRKRYLMESQEVA